VVRAVFQPQKVGYRGFGVNPKSFDQSAWEETIKEVRDRLRREQEAFSRKCALAWILGLLVLLLFWAVLVWASGAAFDAPAMDSGRSPHIKEPITDSNLIDAG